MPHHLVRFASLLVVLVAVIPPVAATPLDEATSTPDAIATPSPIIATTTPTLTEGTDTPVPATPTPAAITMDPDGPSFEVPPVGLAQAAAPSDWTTLYDQMDGPMPPPANGITSQDFQDDLDALDAMAADDFSVPAGPAWEVAQIEVAGFYPGGTPSAAPFPVRVTIYEDTTDNWRCPVTLPQGGLCDRSGGLPGLLVYEEQVPAERVQGYETGNLIVELEHPVALWSYGNREWVHGPWPPNPAEMPGHFWISVQPVISFPPQWAWQKRTSQAGNESAWRNPGGGFGRPQCLEWGYRVVTCGSAGGCWSRWRRGSGRRG